MISINEAQVHYRNHIVLRDIDLHIQNGERIALLGKSGAGKSTLLKLFYQALLKNNQRVGWIPQESGLVDNLSSFHNVYIGQLDLHHKLYNLLNLIWPQKVHKKKIETLLTSLSLSNLSSKPVAELSGGQQQRVAIARALYSQSSILLADEPIAHLDGPMANNALDKIIQHSNTTVIALHDVDQALAFSDRIIGINHGRIMFDAATKDIYPEQLTRLYEA
jgi:phosphonate transport system ATP-binding protein